MSKETIEIIWREDGLPPSSERRFVFEQEIFVIDENNERKYCTKSNRQQ